ncbi:MAG: InlB B-repeat-containing protein [Treponema sp.]|nr:InlB B-repeat-containing protein [Treponema sp.]
MKKSIGLMSVLLASLLILAGCESESDSPTASTVATTETTIHYCNVSFVSMGGSLVASQKIEKGKTVTQPENPTKESDDGTNYFGGWYKDEACTDTNKYDFSTPVTASLILYAKWLSVPDGSYLVSFDSKCDTQVDSQIVEGGKTAAEPAALTKTGYAFSHWSKGESDEAFDFATAIQENTELDANWNESGIYSSGYDASTLYSINIYDSLEADSESTAW